MRRNGRFVHRTRTGLRHHHAARRGRGRSGPYRSCRVACGRNPSGGDSRSRRAGNLCGSTGGGRERESRRCAASRRGGNRNSGSSMRRGNRGRNFRNRRRRGRRSRSSNNGRRNGSRSRCRVSRRRDDCRLCRNWLDCGGRFFPGYGWLDHHHTLRRSNHDNGPCRHDRAGGRFGYHRRGGGLGSNRRRRRGWGDNGRSLARLRYNAARLRCSRRHGRRGLPY